MSIEIYDSSFSLLVGEPVANLYRWEKDPTVHSTRPKKLRESKRTPELVEAVRQLRLEQKTWGKEKIARRLQEDGSDTRISTVGYILTDLIAGGIAQAYDHFISGSRKRRKNKSSRPHAIRLSKGFKPTIPRETIQVDSVHVELPDGTKVCHINAICPVTRVCYGEAFTSASAENASIFLKNMIDYMPFKVQAIQTDQGSEFRGEFETTC